MMPAKLENMNEDKNNPVHWLGQIHTAQNLPS